MPVSVSRAAQSSLARSQSPPPFQLQQEYAVDEVINAAQVPADVISQRRPPVPQQVFPERFGYYQNPPTIYDVLATDRWAPTFRSWVNGGAQAMPPPEYNGREPNINGPGKNSLSGLNYGEGP